MQPSLGSHPEASEPVPMKTEGRVPGARCGWWRWDAMRAEEMGWVGRNGAFKVLTVTSTHCLRHTLGALSSALYVC